jgi:aarF domain-containing kinase
MMLLDNLIHSDLHPGNILVRLTPPRGLLGAVYTALDKIKHSGHVSATRHVMIAAACSTPVPPCI